MKIDHRWLLVVIPVAALLGGAWWLDHHDPPVPPAPRRMAVRHPLVRQEAFSNAQLTTFLDRAMAAEAMTDPLQRCLTYPDPPDSHWSRTAVAAHCHYRTQPYLHADEAFALIRAGQGRELDRRLAEALHKQRSGPDSRGLLDHIYLNDFNDGSALARARLEAWKVQSPRSAFAYAASGLAYVDAAGDARGGGWASETPASNMEAMEELLKLARADLETATKIDSTVAPIYQAMLTIARMDGDDDYANQAVRAGLEADPFDYALFAQRMASAQPKWGGSMDAMRTLAAEGEAKAANNPLLELLLTEPDAYQEGICGCGGSIAQKEAVYTDVLDRIAAIDTLSFSGNNARYKGLVGIALVYLSEALRFNPDRQDDRRSRLGEISTFQMRPVLRDAARRAMAGEADRIMATDPKDPEIRGELGQIYVELRQWDKAWSISSDLIDSHPDQPRGWLLRMWIQKGQPRPGLTDTEDYLMAHFSYNDEVRMTVDALRSDSANRISSH